MNAQALMDVPIRGERSYNIGNYDSHSIAYEIMSMIADKYEHVEDQQRVLDAMVVDLTENPLATNEIVPWIMNTEFFMKHKVVHAMSMDQNRRIMNSIYSTENCNNCGSNKVKKYTIQERGLDEPSTVYISCTNCKQNYKTSE